MIDLLYSRIARARRRYYQRRPHLRRRLAAPVISIGNLTLGGSGKTPLAAEIARMLLDMGERPAILSRGYARRVHVDGVVVVSDGRQLHSDVEHAGDEPFMLARMVPHAAVLVSSSRYVAGRLAECRLGSTVHVLDDGFQHFDLMRDIDLLIAPETLEDVRTLPAGRFREPLDAASAADALLIEGAPGVAVAQDFSPAPHGTAEALCRLVPISFAFARRLGGPAPDKPVFAFAGIARPERFYRDLENAGWQITGHRSFRDHHHYSRSDIEAIVRAARQSGALLILTTAKDAVRLGNGVGCIFPMSPAKNAPDPFSQPPIVAMPLEISIEPRFREWLAARLQDVRSA